jgi:ubiquinone/menaquinone biosynthesis C-methylase UbiE
VNPGEGYERVAHLYDFFASSENMDFFVACGVEAGEIMDIGAGTGRIAIPMAERDVNVWCVEPSTAMLHEFRLKLQSKPKIAGRIKLIQADAAGFRLARTFPAALMSGSFDHLMNRRERLEALTNIGRHLDAGGRLVFDIGLGYMNDSPLKLAGEKTVSGKTYRRLVGRRVLPAGLIDYTLVFETVENGRVTKRIEQKSSAGISDRDEVHHLLKAAGFKIAKEFGGYQRGAYREGDDILVIEAVKQPA